MGLSQSKSLLGFELSQELGRGATAIVYQCRKKDDPKSYALKVYHPGLWSDESVRHRCEQEFKVFRELKHPNIVSVIEAYWDGPSPAILLEHIEGDSLDAIQPQMPFIFPEAALLLGREILNGLDYAHQQGFIHRDLKPANILVSKFGDVYIADFGLAKISDHSTITQSGTILGSPDFMSPEQARGDLVDERSDLFSLGAILYYLMTGTKPFSRHSPLATLSAVIECKPEWLSQRNPKICTSLAYLVHNSLMPNPADRTTSAKELLIEFNLYLERLGISDLTFKTWYEDRNRNSISALQTISENLVRHAESALKQKQYDSFMSILSHLTLVAPESGSFPRLLENYEKIKKLDSENDLRLVNAVKKKKRERVGKLIALIALVLIFWNIVSEWNHASNELRGGIKIPTQALQTHTLLNDQIKSVSSSTHRTNSKLIAHSVNSQMKLNFPKDIVAFWNGKRIDPLKGLTPQKPGKYKLTLVKSGHPPVHHEIWVKSNEPTVINVR